MDKFRRERIMDQVLENRIFAEAKRKYHVDLKKMQEEMMELGVIDTELTMDQIERILRNPFIRYAYVFKDIDFSEQDHEAYKESFVSGQKWLINVRNSWNWCFWLVCVLPDARARIKDK